MAVEKTPSLGLNFGWVDGDSNWGGAVNWNWILLDAVAVPFSKSATVTAPPASPVEGDRYIVPTGATGVWAAHVGRIAYFASSQWVYYQPNRGWYQRLWDTRQTVVWDGSAWVVYLDAITPELMTSINSAIAAGISTAGDRLAVSGMKDAVVIDADAASDSADASEASRQAAVTAADNAAFAKVGAEAARDASQAAALASAVALAAKDTIALGRAAVADGAVFWVKPNVTDGLIRFTAYTRVSSITQAFIGSLVLGSEVDALGQIYDSSAFALIGFLDAAGVLQSTSAYRATDFLQIEEGVSYSISALTAGNARSAAWYDASKVFISSSAAGTGVLATTTATAPAGARYLRASCSNPPTAADVRAVGGRYNIAKLLSVLTQHPAPTNSDKVAFGALTLTAQLNAMVATQTALLARQKAVVNDLDMMSDASAPYFVNTWAVTKGVLTPASQGEVVITSRVSNTVFTVTTGGGASIPAPGGSIVVKDDAAGTYSSYGVKANSGDTVTVFGTLPASISVCQTMHDSVNGQHLSRFGYKALADHIAAAQQKYAYRKKNPIFVYHPPICSYLAYNNPNIYNLTKTAKLIDVTVLGNAGNGGYVAGTTSLPRTCNTASADVNITTGPLSTYLSRSYTVVSAGAGDGIEITFDVNGLDGFIDIPVSAERLTYDTSLVTEGRVRLQVLGDGTTVFHDVTYDAGLVNYAKVNYSGATRIAVRMTLADAVPSALHLYGIYAYQKSPETPVSGLFSAGDVVAFLGDSWTQYPQAVAGEILPLRPDGSTGDGMQFLSVRLKERLAAAGIAITTHNMGKGGQTSAWGAYWVDKILALTPKPTHCVVSFWVNDYNSAAAAVSGADSAYDFDPLNMWGQKVQSAGGKKGAVTVDQWFANLQAISRKLLAAGIKPIILAPGHSASGSQTQGFQQVYLNKLATGFNNTNEDGGRE